MEWMKGLKKIKIEPKNENIDESNYLTEVKPKVELNVTTEKTLNIKPILLPETKPKVEPNVLPQLNPNAAKQTPANRKKNAKAVDQADKNNGLNDAHIDDDKAEDQLHQLETYSDYKPAKLTIGVAHPDPVVETASLSSVAPTDINYELVIPKKTISKGALSALQLESIIYASQAHEQFLADDSRAGFLIGDGAGVGKGRTLAGVILENYLRGRTKAIWVSVSNDLLYDAERDLTDIGAPNIDVYALNKLQYAKLNSVKNGRIDSGVVFSTYSSLISGSKNAPAKFNTRLKQLVEWFGTNGDGCIIFDECHKAKHLIPSKGAKPTKTGMAVLELQKLLPKARVVYASATGASEPNNMAYMIRLGLWGEATPFRNFAEFQRIVEKRGVSAMELVAMDMKLRGMYIARQLSFKGVTFKIEEVALTPEFKQTYNDSVKLWVEAKKNFSEATILLEEHPKIVHMMWAQFWSAHQRFFKYLCIAAKVDHAVELAQEAIENGKCVVIGLQSTGEARTLDVLNREDGELDEIVSTAKSVFQNLVEKQFPAPVRGFLDKIRNPIQPTEKNASTRSVRNRNSALKRKVLNDLDIQPRKKKALVIYSESEEDERDMDDDKKQTKKKYEPKSKGKVTKKGKSKANKIDSDDFDSDDSDADDFSGDESTGEMDSNSGSDSDSDSESDYSTEYDSSDQDTPYESDSDIANSDNVSDQSSEYDSDYDMEVNDGKKVESLSKKAKTMQEKVHECILHRYHQSRTNLSKMMVQSYCNRSCDLKEGLLEKIESMGSRLPPNTLDKLINDLGGPEKVAELTGRKGRIVKDGDDVRYESRVEDGIQLEKLNLIEKERFMDGDKIIAIISEAASNGISLQSDRRAKNRLRRVHITLELPWSADRAIQQFGRTHRSNQVNAPEYTFLISELAGERRFASSVSKRLESLGALTHADRRATETRNLSQFNVDNSYGREALQSVMSTISSDLTHLDDEETIKMFQDIQSALAGVDIGKDPTANIDMSRFLNRILGMPVDLQNKLFDIFSDTLDEIILREKKSGRFDMGILDLGNTQNAEKLRSIHFLREHATGTAPIDLTTVVIDRGITWEEALKRYEEADKNDYEGFYLSRHQRGTARSIALCLLSNGPMSNADLEMSKVYSVHFQTFRPHTGQKFRHETMDEVQRFGTRTTNLEMAKELWETHYQSSAKQCSHMFWGGRCFSRAANLSCNEGMRRRKYTVASGSIFAVWNRIVHHLNLLEYERNPRVIRLKLTDDTKIVGVLLPEKCVEALVEDLKGDSREFSVH